MPSNPWLLQMITLLVVGGIGAYSLLAQRSPDAKKVIDAIVPFKGVIGLAAIVYGFITIINALSYTEALNSRFISVLAWFLWFISGLLEITLGFLFSYDLIAKFAFANKGAESEQKALQFRDKIAAKQSQLGIVALIFAILWPIFNFALLR